MRVVPLIPSTSSGQAQPSPVKGEGVANIPQGNNEQSLKYVQSTFPARKVNNCWSLSPRPTSPRTS